MPYQWKKLFFWYFLYHLIGEPLRDYLLRGRAFTFFQDILVSKYALIFGSDIFTFFLYALLSYSALYYFWPKQKKIKLFALIILSIVTPIFVRYSIQEVLFEKLFGFSNYFGHDLTSYFRDNLYFAFRYSVFGILFYFITLSLYNARRANALVVENQNMQLSMLRSQINPHFLLNSLNNIYSLIYHKSEDALGSVSTLSDMLKYTLYENKEIVTVNEELAYIKKYVDLQRIRYDYDITYQVHLDDSVRYASLPQFIILPLVENAFKHGNLREQPIELSITQKQNHIVIKCKNKVGHMIKDDVGGVGIDNIKKRLHLIYPENHKVLITATDDEYSISIKLPFHD